MATLLSARKAIPRIESRDTRLDVTIDMDILSDPAQIEHVISLIQVECRKIWQHDTKVRFNVPVALAEALSNAMLRGNGADQSRHVHVTVYTSGPDGILVVDVADEGMGFDIARPVDPTLPENISKEGGRGIFLMHALSDEVSQPSSSTVRLVMSDKPKSRSL